MLKLVFWVLLLVNAVLLGLNFNYLGNWTGDTHDPARLKLQQHADQLKILSVEQALAASNAMQVDKAADERAEKVADASEDKSAVKSNDKTVTAENNSTKVAEKPAEKVAEKVADKVADKSIPKPADKPAEKTVSADKNQPALACLEVGNFLPAEATRFEEKLKTLGLGERQARHTVSDIATFMVYIPPLGSKEGADKKAGELRNHAVTDFFIIQDQSAMRWGISLGVFKTEEAAKAHLANLNTKGVKTARIGPRTVSSEKISYQLRALTAQEKKNVELIKANFTAQEVHECTPSADSKK